MKKEHDIKAMISQVMAMEGEGMTIDEEAVMAEFRQMNANRSGIAIKVLTILGGVLATLAFLGCLVVAGFYNSGMALTTLGIFSIAGALVLNKVTDKLIFDTAAVTFFTAGIFLLSFGLGDLRINDNVICIVLIVIALGTLFIIQNYILAFIAVLVANGAFIALLMNNRSYNLLYVFVALLIVGILWIVLKEAVWVTRSRKTNRLYDPIRTGLICSLLGALVFIGNHRLMPLSFNYSLVSALAAITAISYITPDILDVLQVEDARTRKMLYGAVVVVLLPTVLAPAITGSVFVLLVCYWINYKTGVVLGIVGLVYFIAQYYYDLEVTLLTKSILLMASGILFLLFYWFIHKKPGQDAKV